MTRRFLIFGLMLLAAFVPLACVPIAVFVLDARVVVAGIAQIASAHAPSVTLFALALLRAPPSR